MLVWFTFCRTPDLQTPQYTILKRTGSYEIRRYEPFIVAQAPLDLAAETSSSPASGASAAAAQGQPSDAECVTSGRPQIDPAGPGMKAFNALAGYLFGANERGEKMEMTTPVFTSTEGNMQFFIGEVAGGDPEVVQLLIYPFLFTRSCNHLN